jgi:hypothetical protein
MIPARLEDVSIEVLRAEAQKYGIPTEGKDKAALIAALRPKRAALASPETSTVHIPAARRLWSRSFHLSLISLAFSLLALIVAGYAAIQEKRQADVALESLITELQRSADERKRFQTNEWQEGIVYRIIDKEFGKQGVAFTGATFDEIKTKYLDEAKIADLDLTKGELKDTTLEGILYRLIKQGAIFQTHDGKYTTNRSELLSGFGRSMPKERAALHILTTLAGIEKGKHTLESLQPIIIKEFMLTPDEYLFVITHLITDGWVIPGDDGKLYCASVPPTK